MFFSGYHYVSCPESYNPPLPAVILDFRPFLCALLRISIPTQRKVIYWNNTTWKKPPIGSKISTCTKLRIYLDPYVLGLWLMTYWYRELCIYLFPFPLRFLLVVAHSWHFDEHMYTLQTSHHQLLESANSFRYSYTSCSPILKKGSIKLISLKFT